MPFTREVVAPAGFCPKEQNPAGATTSHWKGHSPAECIQGQRIFAVEKVRNVFVVGEEFSI